MENEINSDLETGRENAADMHMRTNNLAKKSFLHKKCCTKSVAMIFSWIALAAGLAFFVAATCIAFGNSKSGNKTEIPTVGNVIQTTEIPTVNATCLGHPDVCKQIQLYFAHRKGFRIKIAKLEDLDTVDSEDIIFCIDVEDCEAAARNNRKGLFFNNVDDYQNLDDKAMFMTFDFPQSDVKLPQIPTVNMEVASATDIEEFLDTNNSFQKFIIKPFDGSGADRIRQVSQEQLKHYRGTPYVAQPFFEDINVEAADVLLVNGEMTNFWFATMQGGFERKHFNGQSNWALSKMDNEIAENLKKWFTEFAGLHKDLNGIICIEFLTDKKTNQTYIMECNPRFVGDLWIVDKYGNMPYLDALLLPYLDHFNLPKPDHESLTSHFIDTDFWKRNFVNPKLEL